MRLVVSFVDQTVVIDGEARFVKFDGDKYEGLRGISWDGKVGHRWYDAVAHRESEFFFEEEEIADYVKLWEGTPPPEPPPLPPWEDEPLVMMRGMSSEPILPSNAIPVPEPDMEAFTDAPLPAPDDPPPAGQERLVSQYELFDREELPPP